jgi:hypothetical protein
MIKVPSLIATERIAMPYHAFAARTMSITPDLQTSSPGWRVVAAGKGQLASSVTRRRPTGSRREPRAGRSFKTKAERVRSALLVSHETSGPTAEPLSSGPSPGDVTVADRVRRWIAEQWEDWRPRWRASAIEALTRFVPLAVIDGPVDPPDGIRRRRLTSILGHDDDLVGHQAHDRVMVSPWEVAPAVGSSSPRRDRSRGTPPTRHDTERRSGRGNPWNPVIGPDQERRPHGHVSL